MLLHVLTEAQRTLDHQYMLIFLSSIVTITTVKIAVLISSYTFDLICPWVEDSATFSPIGASESDTLDL